MSRRIMIRSDRVSHSKRAIGASPMIGSLT
jgi:hypothetical protein